MYFILAFVLRFLLHLVILYGLWLLARPLIEPLIKQAGREMDYRARLRMSVIRTKAATRSKKMWIYTHIDNLLYLAKNNYEPGISVLRFSVWSGILFVSVFFTSFMMIGEMPNKITFNNPFQGGVSIENSAHEINWALPFLLSSCCAVLPYLRLRYKYGKKEVQASYDLLEVVKILSKFANLSVDAALENTADLLSEGNVLKKPVKILSLAFSNYKDQAELEYEVGRFNKAVATTFSINLMSDLMYLQNEGGGFLRNSLLFLNDAMEQQRSTILSVKSKSRDAIALGSWGNVLVFTLLTGSMIWLLKPHIYFRLQFQTKVGLSFLIFIGGCSFISFVISSLLSKPKLDYF
jgi:hypothetical protein